MHTHTHVIRTHTLTHTYPNVARRFLSVALSTSFTIHACFIASAADKRFLASTVSSPLHTAHRTPHTAPVRQCVLRVGGWCWVGTAKTMVEVGKT